MILQINRKNYINFEGNEIKLYRIENDQQLQKEKPKNRIKSSQYELNKEPTTNQRLRFVLKFVLKSIKTIDQIKMIT